MHLSSVHMFSYTLELPVGTGERENSLHPLLSKFEKKKKKKDMKSKTESLHGLWEKLLFRSLMRKYFKYMQRAIPILSLFKSAGGTIDRQSGSVVVFHLA